MIWTRLILTHCLHLLEFSFFDVNLILSVLFEQKKAKEKATDICLLLIIRLQAEKEMSTKQVSYIFSF